MLIQNFHPILGGAERQALELATHIRSQGVSVKVLTRRVSSLKARDEVHGIPIHRLPAWGPGVVGSFVFLVSTFLYLLLHLFSFQVIHVHLASSHALVGVAVARLFGKKNVVKIGGGNEVGEIVLSRRTFWGRLKLATFRWLKPTLVVVNQGQKKELEKEGLTRVPVHFIPNGVNLKKYQPASASQKEELRDKWGWKRTVGLFVGRYSPDKLRLDIFENLLTAWKNAKKDTGACLLYMVGEGPLKSAYQDRIEKWDLSDDVYLGGPETNVQPLYQAADFFVLPSQTEGLSNALLEAMATGLPVLASRVPGITDLIQEGRHGYLFNPLDSADIEQALKKITHPSSPQNQISQAVQQVAQAYSIEDVTTQYLKLYQ